MRILIDLQGAQNGSRDRGIGRYVRSLARAIAREAHGHEILFLLNGMFPDHIESVIGHFNDVASRDQFIVFHGVGAVNEMDPANHWRLSASELLYEQMVAALNPDALLIGSLFEGSMDNTVTSIGRLPQRDYVVAVILYDLIPLIDPERYIGYPPAAAWYHRRIENLMRADRMLSISHSARDEALKYLPVMSDRVLRIGTAASDRFTTAKATPGARPEIVAPLAKFGIDRPYIMHTSTFEERKNFEGLLQAYARLPSKVRNKHQLVLVCRIGKKDRARMKKCAAKAGLSRDDMVLTGHVTDDELIALYRHAELFVFPSFHEGFGLPALEAMSCGIPTLGSNVSSVPEVIGWEEAQFDPHDIDGMSRLIERALTDHVFRAALLENAARQAASFKWEEIARSAITAIEDAHHKQTILNHARSAPLALADFAALLAGIPNVGVVSDQDLATTASALAANEATARSIAASAGEAPLTWRIEGPFDSSYSLALVNRETARALAKLGHHIVLHSTEGPGDIPVDPAFLAANTDIAEMYEREPLITQQRADITSRNLYPPRVEDFDTPIALMHGYAWEETGFPAEWVDRFNTHLSVLTVTSRHVRKLMIDNGVKIPIVVTGNGVDHWECVESTPGFLLNARNFRFLHVSSGFPRKGVDILLDAYGRTFSARDHVTLVVKTFDNPHNEVAEMIETRKRARSDYPHIVLIVSDLSPGDLKALYEQCHVLVAPSMAEGYGLPIAEAMLSGLPAITTGWSGQLDFANESNAWLLDYRFEPARSHFGLFNSAWVRVDIDDLCRAMNDAFNRPPGALREMADIGRAQLLAEHRWSDVASRLVESVRKIRSEHGITVPRIGWLTTWNTQCGIAIYSKHLIEHMGVPVTILGNHVDKPIEPVEESHNCCWITTKDPGGLKDVPATLIKNGIEVLVIQFNYGFFNHDDLADLIRRTVRDGIAVVMIMHSTTDPVVEIPDNELFRIASSLALCDRLLVHAIADLNRLKAIGLVDNVALFPLGGLTLAPSIAHARPNRVPLISTYGFCLPHKGLLEMIDAVALLRDRERPVRLRMLNAEFPAPISAELVSKIRQRILYHGLGDLVEFDSRFQEDAVILPLLLEADAVVFAYQQTGESASAAVRYGLATQRPVAVTPLEIFDDLGDAVFRFDGISPAELADGLATLLTNMKNDSDSARKQADAAARWRSQHDYGIVAKRLRNICQSLAIERRNDVQRFQASSTHFKSEVGTAGGTAIIATGRTGILLEGPRATLPAGAYNISIHGVFGKDAIGSATVDLEIDGRNIATHHLPAAEEAGQIGVISMTLDHRSSGVSIRISVPDDLELTITDIIFAPARNNDKFQEPKVI